MSNETKQDFYARKGHAPHFQSTVNDHNSGQTVALLYHDETGKTAQLFAAAPDLLAALTGLTRIVGRMIGTHASFSDWNDLRKCNKAAADAIAKALHG